jgi:hypothetical protein
MIKEKGTANHFITFAVVDRVAFYLANLPAHQQKNRFTV